MQLRRAEVMGTLYWQELDRAERSLITMLLTRFEGEASEAELKRELGRTDHFLYGVAAPRGRDAAQIAGCLWEQALFSVTDQARDAFRGRSRGGARRGAPAVPAAA